MATTRIGFKIFKLKYLICHVIFNLSLLKVQPLNVVEATQGIAVHYGSGDIMVLLFDTIL